MKILIIEDDKRIAEAIQEALTDRHYSVDLAEDGQMGWEYIEMSPYDLIILDLMLPKINGINLCQKIRSRGDTTPILMLTAKDTSNDKVLGFDVGADDYVVKPFDLPELLARVRALVRRVNAILPVILEWQEIRLNPNTCEVYYGENIIHFTPTEYRLLELLMRHPYQVLNRRQIVDHLWSFEEPPGEDTVKVHIRSLRQKLKSVGANPNLIETVYGLGYRLKKV